MPTRAKSKPSPLQGVVWPVIPFFKLSVPYLPPGINHSYKIIKWKTKEGKWAHTLADSDESKQFKENVAAYLSYGQGIEVVNWDCIADVSAISVGKEKVPLFADITAYFPTLWKRDIDGCEKHIIDATCKFLESKGSGINDNTIVEKRVRKYAWRENPHFEISLSVCLERI